jgi:hypothetical protein
MQTMPEGLTRDQYRSRRHRAVRASTISIKRMSKRELEIGRVLFPPVDHDRPRTRADCADGPRPCLLVSCKHHLYLDVSPRTGAIKLNYPDLEPDQMSESCVLDVADRGGATLERVAEIANLTRERVRQIEVDAFGKLERQGAIRALAADHGVAQAPVREGSMATCKESGCTSEVFRSMAPLPPGGEGLCSRHLSKFTTARPPSLAVDTGAPASCSVAGCHRKRAGTPTYLPGGDGMCGPHRAGLVHAQRAAAPSGPATPSLATSVLAKKDEPDVSLIKALEAYRLVERIGWELVRAIADRIENRGGP